MESLWYMIYPFIRSLKMTMSPDKGQKHHTSKGKDGFRGSTLSYKPCRYRRCMALYTSAYPFCYVLKPLSSTAFAYVPLKHHQNMWISISWRPWRTCWTSNWKQLVSWTPAKPMRFHPNRSFSEPFLTPNKRLPFSKALVILGPPVHFYQNLRHWGI